MSDYVERYPAPLIIASTWLSQREKLLLLSVATAHSFDAEGRCGFQPEYWPDIASQLAISPVTAARYWVRLRDAHVIEPAQDRNAPYSYWLINGRRLNELEKRDDE